MERFRAIRIHCDKVQEYRSEKMPALDCLVATMKGLYRIADGVVIRLLSGYFFGITRHHDDWFVFERLGRRGRLIRFRLIHDGIGDVVQLTTSLSPGCHQIDFVNDELLIADTYNNRIGIFHVEDDSAELVEEYYPVGALADGRSSDNYVHLNSLWHRDGYLYAVFHNETRKTGRKSEIAKIDWSRRELEERWQTDAGHAHNIVLLDGVPLFCDSDGARLMLGERTLYATDLFTRGLSVTSEYTLVGKSEHGLREERENLAGSMVVLSPSFAPLLEIPLKGMVQDIRSVTGSDMGISANNPQRQLTITGN